MTTTPVSPPPSAVSVSSAAAEDAHVGELSNRLLQLGPREAAELLRPESAGVVAAVLKRTNPAVVQDVLGAMTQAQRAEVFTQAPALLRQQWETNERYAEGTVGRLMDPPTGVFAPDLTVAEAIERLRELVKQAFITYLYVVDADGRLMGVVVMREMLLSPADARLRDIMIRQPFALDPAMPFMDAMKQVLTRHYPVYPVCAEGKLVGVVRGQTLFEQQAIEISAQAGAMVGVDREERLATPWPRSLKFRHPWLQLNLLTAFVAAAVVGVFQGTIEQIAVLAVFLPVLAGQSGNTGCQALAVTLRAMTLGEMKAGMVPRAVFKEALLGLFNGMLVGITAGLGMYVAVRMQAAPDSTLSPVLMGVIVFLAMTGACVASGISGALVPVVLKRMGADPATASSIFLTTATDVASMGLFLGLATLLLL
ncbi:MAG: magnesium transporter [Phycisphaeraceae bacterium]